MEFEKIEKCPLCKEKEFRHIFSAIQSGTKSIHVICVNCSLVFQNPRPTIKSLEKYYKNDYIKIINRGNTNIEPSIQAIHNASIKAKRLFTFLKPYLKSGMTSVLDIGSSAGVLLNMFKNIGYKTYGIEPNETFALYSKKFGHIIEIGTYHEGLFKNEKFDVITMSHVLEHCPDPIWILASLKNKLKENGIIAIEVPNIMKPNGPLNGFFQLPHLYTFSKSTLIKVIQLSGFCDIIALDDNYPHLRILIQNNCQSEYHRYSDIKLNYISVIRSIRRYQWRYNFLLGPCQFMKNSIRDFIKKILGENVLKQLISYRYFIG